MNRKIALITGGSRGLGRNMALHLAQRGMDLIVTYHSRRDEAESIAAEAQALGAQVGVLQLDVGDSSRLHRHHGGAV